MARELVINRAQRRLASDPELEVQRRDGRCLIVSRANARRVMVHDDPREPGGVLLYGAFAHRDRLSPRTVLLMADRIRAGALTLVGDRYVVRFAVGRAHVDSSRLAESVRYVGDLAAALARSAAGESPEASIALYAHFSE